MASTRTRIDDWLTADKLASLTGWAISGLTIEDIAGKIGISKVTLYEWMKKDANIMNALKNGREEADNIIINALFEKAKGGDTTAQIFWLKNRQSHNWRDRVNQEHTFPQGDAQLIVDNSDND